MVNKTTECDVCIVGGGAGGCVAAREFSNAGLKVIVLEAGELITDNNSSYRKVMLSSPPAWARQPFGGGWGKVGYPWTSRNLGGGTVFYGGASFRYRRIDFEADRLGLPTDLPLDWPYTYEDLEPYYLELEKILGVAADNQKDPTFPSTDCGSCDSPHSYSAEALLIKAAAEKHGLNPFPTPLAIKNTRGARANKFSGCYIENFSCDGARSDAPSTFLANESAVSPIIVKTNAHVSVIKMRNVYEVESVQLESGAEVKAQVFILACNAIQTASLMLRSVSKFAPNGVGNSYDVVGRGLCLKMSEYVTGFIKTKKLNKTLDINAGVFSTLAITDYYEHTSMPHGLGGMLYEARYGFPYKNSNEYTPLRLECILSDIPSPYNQVFNYGSDVGIDYQVHPVDSLRLNLMASKTEELLRSAGCEHIFREPSGWGLGSTHLHGTCRAGTDVRTSVVNPDCQVHGITNLFVADGSFMPFPGAVNPTLTIQANALRVSRQVASSLFRQSIPI